MIRADIISLVKKEDQESVYLDLTIRVHFPRPPIDSSSKPDRRDLVGLHEGDPIPAWYMERMESWKKERSRYETRVIIYQDLLGRINKLRLGEVLLDQESYKDWTIPPGWLCSKTNI